MELPLANRDPASAIAEFEQILASNSGEDAFDAAIKLLAAKLMDEYQVRSGKSSEFTIHKSPDATYRAVQELYRRAVQTWPLLNGVGPSLEIPPQHLVRSMRPLLGWRLCDSDLASLDATLERLVAKHAKGALGQYFTPREVIRFCIEILNPTTKDKIIDPACGSGGFLFEATHHVIRSKRAAPSCLGVDFGAKAIKVAALLAAATPKAKITISKANSIDGRPYAQQRMPEWQPFLSRDTGANTARAIAWREWNKLGCTLLATNPPFAGDIDESDILDAYESQQGSPGRNAVSREHLFLERAVQMLRPGGRLAIVLPQGLLANQSSAYLRSWLFRKCRVLGVVGLHPHAFLPYTSVKTALLFAEKLPAETTVPSDYRIFFAISRDCGKDSRGRVVGNGDYNSIAASFTRFLVTEKLPWASSLDYGGDGLKFETVRREEVQAAGRLDAEYYEPRARALLRQLDTKPVTQIASLVDPRTERFRKGLFKEVQYLDISSVDSKTGLPSPSTIQASDAPSRATYIVQPGDVLVSTVRPDRNVVALVTSSLGPLPTVASNGFCVLRTKTIPPELLFAYCKTESFRRMLSRHATASMYPTVTDRDVLSIPFVEPSADVSKRITSLVRSGLAMLEQAQEDLRKAISLMAEHIETPYAIEEQRSPPELRQKRTTYRTKKSTKS